MFDGVYHGKKSHPNDIEQVLERAQLMGVEKIILTGTDLGESKTSLEIIERFKDSNTELFTTVGVHPTRCQEFLNYSSPEAYEQELRKLIRDNPKKIVAIGECGLDYARLEFCPKEIQMKYFLKQLEIAHDIQLPLFFHNRDTQGEFLEVVKAHRNKFSAGVVHSFDGPLEEALELIKLDLYIGINGCSLRTQENLDVVKQIPLDRILIETDAPWCDIRPTHKSNLLLANSLKKYESQYPSVSFPVKKKEKFAEGSMVKSRNEPCCVINVLHVVAELHDRPLLEIANIVYNSTKKLFFPTL
ncbi:hypothetical protein DSO57_1038761 [Entomophthora muscae]|nr:hypothetical protein DSO57_1038761 [Entomophthora muscae]